VTTHAATALGDRLEESAVLDPPAKLVGKTIRDAVPRGPVKDSLSGTWLGHALHPLLTDLPIGAWTSALMLDLFGGEGSEQAAERLLTLGLAFTPAAVVTGFNDWADTEPADAGVRRAGLIHAALNAAAATAFLGSVVARRRGNTGGGKALSAVGMGLVGAGGWIGGHLSYTQGVGVDRTAFESGPEDWTPAFPDRELTEDHPAHARVEGVDVLVVRRGERLFAMSATCNHRGGLLYEGELGEGTITCPLHGSCFRLEDGEVLRGPAQQPQPLYDARVRDGMVEVRRARR
jgi:nitrite reductase/ring-hydroxylating ferredoxin subunit/uncharacterized membrane protein